MMSKKEYQRWLKRSREVSEATYEVGCGPLNFNVIHARRAGWSRAQINRIAEKICAMGKRGFAFAHRNGPVLTCPCMVCDPRVKDKDTDSEHIRASWRRRGLWPMPRQHRVTREQNLKAQCVPPLGKPKR